MRTQKSMHTGNVSEECDMKKGLANLGLTMDTVREADEQSEASFVLIGISNSKGLVKFHLDTKQMNQITVIVALEQFKNTVLNSKPKNVKS